MGATELAPCKVVVDSDHLSASLVFDQQADPESFTRADLSQLLEQAQIKFTPGIEKRVDKLTEILRSGKLPSEPVLMAKGRPADDGDNGRFELAPELVPESDESEQGDRIDFYQQKKIITVGEGEVVGTVYPPRPAQPGEDVYGQVIKPTPRRAEIRVGSNLKFADDGKTLVATADGRVIQNTLDVAVVDVLEVSGDVDFAAGNIDSASDVVVRGNVLDLFSVKTRKSIEVGGNVEAATLSSGGDIVVRGGICGKEKGKVVCGGELFAKFIDSVEITCEGDIHVGKEALNCAIDTKGSLRIPTGSLIGGVTHARNGGEIKILGSEAGVKTLIGIGMNPDLFAKVKQIDEKVQGLKQTAEKIRVTCKPLIDSLKRLTPEQREKATELMCQADELDAQAEHLLSQKEELLAEMSPVEGVSLLINGRLSEGVTITVDHHSVRFDKMLKGPIRIEKRKVENVTEVVGVNQLSGSVQVFPARKLELPGLQGQGPEEDE